MTNPLDILKVLLDNSNIKQQNNLDSQQNTATVRNAYQKGVDSALKKMGETHATEAVQSGVSPVDIANHPLVSEQPPPETPAGDIRPLVITGKSQNQIDPTQLISNLVAAHIASQQPQQDITSSQTNSIQVPKQGMFERNDIYGQRLENVIKQQKIQNGGQDFNTQESIQKMADLNKVIDQKLPGYQVTQNADGNFIVHPKAAGIMAQMSPEQLDSLSSGLVSNQIVPSQLPRIQKAQVVAAALAKNPNYSPAQADMEFAANKMGAGAFEKNFNNLDSFHRDFEKNSDYLLKLSSNFDRSKLPLINSAIVGGGRSITGDPKATQLLQAINTVANGYARLQNPTLSGQALSDASRKEAQDIISGFSSDVQLKSLLDPNKGSMRIDAQNRIDAAQEIRDRISSTYSKDKKQNQTNSVKGRTITLPSGKTITLGQ
jgi:hypothetical protein